MHRLATFFLWLALALSLGLGSAAHANEAVGCIEVSGGTSVDHSDGDGDQVSGDAGKAYSHHHGGCHGDHVGVPVSPESVVTAGPLRIAAVERDAAAMAAGPLDPALRPPQA